MLIPAYSQIIGHGHRYFARRPTKNHFRLSIACVTEEQIETGCRLLARGLSLG